MTRLFTGDFSTGNFSQWRQVLNKTYTGDTPANSTSYGYPAQIVAEDTNSGYACRFEVRTGDVPRFGGGERSEVQGMIDSDVLDGQSAWYAFSVKFDSTFPADHGSLGWADVAQWHDNSLPGSLYPPVIEWGFAAGATPAGYWWLTQSPQSTPGIYDLPGGSRMLLQLPLNLGQWHDIKMQMTISTDPTQGFVKAWWNGAPQTLLGGSTTFTGQTMVPTAAGVKNQIGYYRQNGVTETGIIYHTGFRIADSEGSL